MKISEGESNMSIFLIMIICIRTHPHGPTLTRYPPTCCVIIQRLLRTTAATEPSRTKNPIAIHNPSKFLPALCWLSSFKITNVVVGDAVGESVGDNVGDAVGDTVGDTVGDIVGDSVKQHEVLQFTIMKASPH